MSSISTSARRGFAVEAGGKSPRSVFSASIVMQSAQSLEKMDTRSVQNMITNLGPLEAHINRAREASTADEVREVIESAVESAQVLVFGELLDLPSVKQVCTKSIRLASADARGREMMIIIPRSPDTCFSLQKKLNVPS